MTQYIMEAQKALENAGLYTAGVDGDFGKGSRDAVLELLAKAGFEVKPIETSQSSDAPHWITEATKHIGLKEIAGSKHNPTILSWVKKLGGWFTDDEVPWCGTFIAQCLKESGRGVPQHWYRALAYESYGTRLTKPAYGCIGVMARKGGGHVTFIVGETKDGKHLVGLGGNQSNAVNLMKFEKSRFTAFVWPTYKDDVLSSPYQARYSLPSYSNSLKLSSNEA